MHSSNFLTAVCSTCEKLDFAVIESIAESLSKLEGRLFILGVGGSAANASHAANDFRKLCGIESYAPTDNVAELTARANDEGFDTVFSGWLKVSKLSSKDAILILSVGGGNERKKISVNLIRAIKLAKAVGAKIYGIVGRADGYTARHADISVIIPTVEEKWITPISEAMQGIVWHCLVSNPLLQTGKTKW